MFGFCWDIKAELCFSSSSSKMLTFFCSTGFGASSTFAFFIVPGLPLPMRAASEFLKSSGSFAGSGFD